LFNPTIEDEDYGESSQRINEAVDFVSSDWLLPSEPDTNNNNNNNDNNNNNNNNKNSKKRNIAFDSLIE
jgi:hypothetical protein